MGARTRGPKTEAETKTETEAEAEAQAGNAIDNTIDDEAAPSST